MKSTSPPSPARVAPVDWEPLLLVTTERPEWVPGFSKQFLLSLSTGLSQAVSSPALFEVVELTSEIFLAR